MKKRVGSLLLILAMVFGLMPAMAVTAWAGQAGISITINAPAINDDIDILTTAQKTCTVDLLNADDNSVNGQTVAGGQTLSVKLTASEDFWNKFSVDESSFVLRNGAEYKNLTMTEETPDDSTVRKYSFSVPSEIVGAWELHFQWSVKAYSIVGGNGILKAVQDLDDRTSATYSNLMSQCSSQADVLVQFIFTFDGSKVVPDAILTQSVNDGYEVSPTAEGETALTCFHIGLGAEKYTSTETALTLEETIDKLNPPTTGLTLDFAVFDTPRCWKAYDLRNTTVSSFEAVQDGTTLTVKKLKYFYNNSTAVPIALRSASVCAVGSVEGTKYGSVKDAIEATKTTNAVAEANGTPTAIYLIADHKENVTIPAGRKITLDLNGCVLKADNASTSVITNNGILYIVDSDTTAAHHFKVGADGLWKLTDETTNAKPLSSLTAIPAENDIITVTGGCITGVNMANSGGGVLNYGTLTLSGGSIVGNKATNGGGVYVVDTAGNFTMTGGIITGNVASSSGGGVYIDPSTSSFTMTGGIITGNTANSGGGVYYKKGCFIEGTQITMADGSTKNIEDVAVGELVKSFNHETGMFENNKVTIAYAGESTAPYFTLHFTGGIDLSICDCHDLFEQSACRYVTVSEANCESMIGKYFYCAESNTWEKLLSVTKSEDAARYYSIYVAKTVNCLANGMLTVPDDIDAAVNIFTFNADLTVNQAALQADIEKYGLCTMEDFPQIKTQEEFDALNCKYINIVVGKGLVTHEEVEAAYHEWYEDTVEEPSVPMAKSVQSAVPLMAKTAQKAAPLMAKSVQNAAPLMTAGSLKSTSNTASSSGVTLGGTAQIVGNAGSNLYLASDSKVTISTTDKPTTMSVGVTLANGKGQFTTNGTSTDTQYFTSDSPIYKVKFNDNGTNTDTTDDYLELADYDLASVVSNTDRATLDMDAMSTAQAIDIAKHLKPYDGLSNATVIAYAKASDYDTTGKYEVITADSSNDWNADTAMTLAEMRADVANKDYFVIGTVVNHTHEWTYAEGGTGKENTLTATCANTDGNHNGSTTETITIVKPARTTYGDEESASAAIQDNKTTLGGFASLPGIQYQKKTGESTYDTAVTTPPTAAGTYKASMTVDTNKTAYVEYTIAPKQLTISGTTVDDKTYNGSTAATATAGTLSGIASEDTGNVTVSIQSAEFADEKAGTGKTVTVQYSISGTAADNYLAPVDDSSFTATISQKALTISAESGKSTTVSEKSYDGSVTASATVGTVVGVETGDSVEVEVDSAAFDSKDAGTYKSVSVVYKLSGADAENYSKPEDDTKTANITPKQINVAADSKNSYVGSALAELTYTVDAETPLVSGDTLTGALATNANKDVVGSTYQITQGTLNNSNYSITFTAGTYTVKALEGQTISFPDGNQTKTYGDAAFTKTVSGAATTVSYESSDPAVAAVNSATGEVTILKAGTATITAKAAATAVYNQAEASYILTVNKASQNVPSVGKTDETVKGKADGKLTGVDSTMEYRKAEDSAYTAITGTEVTGLTAGTYKVRYAAKTNYNASPDQMLTIGSAKSITVTFDSMGGSKVETVTGLSYRDTVSKPAAPTRAESVFNGWYQNGAVYDFTGELTDDITLEAHWTLKETALGAETTICDDGTTTTKIQVIGDTGIQASGLESIAKAVKEDGNTNNNVKIILTAEKTSETSENSRQVSAIRIEAGSGKTVELLAIDLTKFINNTDSGKITDTNGQVIEVLVPFAADGKQNICIYRYHEGEGVLTFAENQSGADGTFYLEDNVIHLFTTKFSTYAIGYSVVSGSTDIEVAAAYTVTGKETENGKLTLSSKKATQGKKITITVTPDDGYYLEKLTAADKKGNSITLTKVSETTYTFQMPASDVTVSAVYAKDGRCPQDETCVYAKFTDSDPKAWYHPGVHFCVENGYMVGIAADQFDPFGTLSRGMIVTMLWRMENSPASDYAMSFMDVADGLWYTEAIRWAQSTGVVKGYDENTFGPNNNVTREQLAAILMRYAAFKGIDVSERADLGRFTDAESISDWAKENVRWANAVGMLLGRTETTIVPTGNAARAEAANMVQRFCETVLQ